MRDASEAQGTRPSTKRYAEPKNIEDMCAANEDMKSDIFVVMLSSLLA